MKLAVTGSRVFATSNISMIVWETLDKLHATHSITLLISGHAVGVDQIAESWAVSRSIPISTYMPDWKRYGRGAGLVRNKNMVDDADQVAAFWNGTSNGTRHAIHAADRKNKLLVSRLIH